MTGASNDDAYAARIHTELNFYETPENVPDLPPIYGLWAQRHCLPLLQEVGFASLEEFLDVHVIEQCERRAPDAARLVSLGAGSGETEIAIAERLRDRGIENLEVTLLELNHHLLERGITEARRRGLADRFSAVSVDLNTWRARGNADVYFANHSLHHLVALEHLFAEVRGSLESDGVFVVNDMVGRNGHVRWPEAADLVTRIWQTMPKRYRWNNIQKQVDDRYPDIDCSEFAFEGVRAQDILPSLLREFYPDVYVTFLNVADPFIDRIYGPNFDVTNADDVAFIEHIAYLDHATIDLGLVTPTHLIASFRRHEVACRYPRQRSPQRTLRHPDRPMAASSGSAKSQEVDDHAEIAALRRDLARAWGRYHDLRKRRAVRIALQLAELRVRLRSKHSIRPSD